ncbi:MAG: hypothetical protein ACOC55_00325 [Candidatus Natronoplasma sp.]
MEGQERIDPSEPTGGYQGGPQSSQSSPGQGPSPGQQPGPGQQQPRYQPQSDLKRTLGMILIFGIIILLVGAILISVSGFIDPDPDDPEDRQDAMDNIRYLRTAGSLLISIGVFLPAIGSAYLLYSKYGLSDQEKLILVIVASASMIAFALVINTAPFGLSW